MKSLSDDLRGQLIWIPALGMAVHPSPDADKTYDADYFAHYQTLADTDMGRALTRTRIEMVARHYDGPVLDVGIGAGQFVESRPDTTGYDVNPAGIDWLKERGLWADLHNGSFDALTFWDALEHFSEPETAVARAQKWVFVSIPVFSDLDHIFASKHFKPGEHIYYWTHAGLVNWFSRQGFTLVEHSTIESDLGREGISSYAFLRRG